MFNRKFAFSLTLLAVVLLGGCEFSRQRRHGQTEFHLTQAQAYLDDGLTDSALAAFGLALVDNPRLTKAHVGMGRIYLDREDYTLASGAFERATKVDPGSFDAHYYLGLARQMMGKVKEAITVYLRALSINPNSFEANLNLAGAYIQENRPSEALSFARRAVDLDPQSLGAWVTLATTHSLRGNYDRAVESYRVALELGEMPEPVLLGLADAHLKLGNFDLATNVLQTLIRQNPSSTSYERLGYAQFKRNRFDDALASFRAALSIDAEDTAAFNGLGVCLMTLYLQSDGKVPAQKAAAINAWRQSLQLRPDQTRIINLLSRYQGL